MIRWHSPAPVTGSRPGGPGAGAARPGLARRLGGGWPDLAAPLPPRQCARGPTAASAPPAPPAHGQGTPVIERTGIDPDSRSGAEILTSFGHRTGASEQDPTQRVTAVA